MRVIPSLGFFIIASTLFSTSLHHANAYSLGTRASLLGMASNGILRRDTSFIYSSLEKRADPDEPPKKAPKKAPKEEVIEEEEPKKKPKKEPKKELKEEPKEEPKQVPKQEPKQVPKVVDPKPPVAPITPADDKPSTSLSNVKPPAKTTDSPKSTPVKSADDQAQYKNADSGAAESVPTEPISWTTIIVLTSIGGLIVVIAVLFACIRRKRRRDMANNIVATSSVAWEQQNNAYEKMEEEDEPQSLGSFTVVACYIPSLDDELAIQPGDKVTILVEYDDGWVNGINESRGGAKGVFPRHCVDMNSVLNDKRSSSMAVYTMVNLN